MQSKKKKIVIIEKENEISTDFKNLDHFLLITKKFNDKEFINDEIVDLILLDDSAGEEKTIELCQKIKSNPKTSNLPLIILLSKENLHLRDKLLDEGVVDFIIKPINFRVAIPRIDAYISVGKFNELLEESKKGDELLQTRSKFLIMGEMLEMITHQWKQPLTTLNIISGSIKLSIKNNRLKYDTLIKKLNDLEQQIKYMNETIHDFKTFFNNKKELKEINLKDIVEKALKLSSHFFKNSMVELSTDLESSFIMADENELIQVLLNIFNNSRDAFIENDIKDKKITISLKEEGTFAYLKIADNAGGIRDDIISKVFEPHFSTKKDKGNGIGLYMSKVIIENHLNGKISAKNLKDGVEFSIKLPIL